MSRDNPVEFDVSPLIRRRHSPRAFGPRLVEPHQIRSLLEAARWAASCYNEQPWRFIVAGRHDPEAHAGALACLAPGNQAWAGAAPLLLFGLVAERFAESGKPNRHAEHDLGLALAQLSLQATALGLSVHPMAGFDAEAVRRRYGVPEGVSPVVALAAGYPGDPATLSDELRQRELAPRQRRPQAEFVFGERFGEALSLPGEDAFAPILELWFGELDQHGLAAPERSARWWKKDPAFDDELRRRFEPEIRALLAGARDGWLASARGRLAAVIVLDQFSRNIYRDTAGMFAADHRALALCLEGMERGLDRALATDERVFLYMPLMHAEDLELQERCVAVFSALAEQLSGPAQKRVENNVNFARRHRDIVARFGRFPHRNAILGRPSTAEEERFLKQPGSSF